MKKLIALVLMLVLTLTLCVFGTNAEETAQTTATAEENSQTAASGENERPKGPPPARNIGTLSLLNMTEEQYAALVDARKFTGSQMIKEGYAESSESGEGAPQGDRPEGEPSEGASEGGPEGEPPEGASEQSIDNVIFYDTLDALLMALNAGDIDGIEIYQSVARYLCITNDNLEMLSQYNTDKEQNTFAELIQNGINSNNFSFMMMENNTSLRDEFNAAIADMKADGTLDRLVQEQIDDLVNGGEIKPVELPHTDGADTVKIAVTGALPPMDYVSADGTPAGFNTAVLAEIANRIGKNIEIMVVDSMGRAAALASGVVDAVFWTRTNSAAQERAASTEDERQAKRMEMQTGMTEEEIMVMDKLEEHIDFSEYGTVDMPESTIVTDPYFSDVLVMVVPAGGRPQGE